MTTNKHIVSAFIYSKVCKKDRFVLKNEYVTEERGERMFCIPDITRRLVDKDSQKHIALLVYYQQHICDKRIDGR